MYFLLLGCDPNPTEVNGRLPLVSVSFELGLNEEICMNSSLLRQQILFLDEGNRLFNFLFLHAQKPY